ncbi:LysE/ArgO family amino acid transporter [Paenibacillus bovis]|uniref:Lysine transporter LysE n=1 Tax=Paenibacillus bovis TaxID=1616788 RepID=A0A172ZEN1_9BACL|nr:LysE/ArgO family amino acid transporter [Paenibacillus bovis]ANF95832.1 lysine transporter LysE [Paenibacillus bovis]
MAGVILHAFILALGLILPLGVQNVFIFQQGMVQRRWWKVLPVVITAGLCDTLLISLAIGGVSVLVLGLPWVKTALMLAGVLFLLYMGYVTWKSADTVQTATAADREEQPNKTAALPARKQILFALSVSLLNPHAILDTIGVIGTSSLQYEGQQKLAFMWTCIIVSWLWFAVLAAAGMAVGVFDRSGRWFYWLNRCSALMIGVIALYLLISLGR